MRVAEFGSFTRAFVVPNVAQPALSRQVRLLEVEPRHPAPGRARARSWPGARPRSRCASWRAILLVIPTRPSAMRMLVESELARLGWRPRSRATIAEVFRMAEENREGNRFYDLAEKRSGLGKLLSAPRCLRHGHVSHFREAS
ncbi:hypothetical protein [Polaromonas sp. C04]|uniref:hypothetical protein n=1 Tax=Polaromonas sp. C04 TaxID=1945857 RepID=UPI002570F3C5|nr:hypothetical protein [Polaromonas sp. C04]